MLGTVGLQASGTVTSKSARSANVIRSPTVQLTEHFTLQEFTYSQNAARAGIPNTPTPEILARLKRLASIMELVRATCGNNAVTITSGYRSPEVNKLCGGSDSSAHMSGLAADFIIPGFGDPYAVCKAIEPHLADWAIDQLIWEYGDWVHLGLCLRADEPRCQCLTIDNSGTSEGI